MKKKNLNLEKKLFLDKEVLAALNTRQQYQVLGGVAYTMKQPCATGGASCETIPYTQDACKVC